MDSRSYTQPTVEGLVEAYLDRVRLGERPTISEYTDLYPDLAEGIRDALSALAFVEEFAPKSVELDEPPPDSPLRKLGDFRILREVGRGGMGVVYEAVQESLGRRVALKVLPFQLSIDPVYVERFHREARVAARLHHTNIVPVFDVGEHEGVHYFAMQFIQGLSLDTVMLELRKDADPKARPARPRGSSALSRRVVAGVLSGQFQPPADAPEPADEREILRENCSPSDATRRQDTAASGSSLAGQVTLSAASTSRHPYYQSVARVALQVADGLAYIHGQGLLHRDIKPSNLLLDTQGVVWITDLGLVHDGDAAALTESGDILGTLRYMAPERLQGHAQPSGDLYSLGLTLYELLTLRSAFSSANRKELVHDVRAVDPPRPRRLAPELPRDLETIVLKLISKDPRQRYQQATELVADLRSFLEDRPIRARRAGALERSWRWCRRNRAYAAMIGSIAALLVVMATGGWLAALLFRGEQAKATNQLYHALVAKAQASRWSRRPGQQIESLRALDDAAHLVPQLDLGDEDRLLLRNEVIACMALVDIRLAEPPRQAPRDTWVLALDAELERYVWTDRDGNLSVRRVKDDVETLELPGAGSRAHVAQFSPDGRCLAVKYHDPGPMIVVVWDLERKARMIEAPGDGWFDFGRDDLFALGQSDSTVLIVDLASGATIRRLDAGIVPNCVRFHPTLPRIAVSSSADSAVHVLDLETGQAVSTFRNPQAVPEISWDPSGRRLACACADYRTYIWDAETGLEQAVLTGHQAEVTHVAFNHAGDLLATYSWDGTTRLWDPSTGQEHVSVPGVFRQFSDDDRTLSFVGNESTTGFNGFGLWSIAAPQGYRALYEPRTADKGPTMVDMSRDGRLMVSIGPPGVRLWDVASGAELAEFGGENEPLHPRATSLFDPTAQHILTSSGRGLRRWPLRLLEAGGALPTGAAQEVAALTGTRRASQDRDGRTVAVVQGEQVHVIDLQEGREICRAGPHAAIEGVALSPDGRWVATGTWHGRGAKVWSAATGEEVCDPTPNAVSATVAFSPDGRWLVVGAEDVFHFFEVGAWRERRRVPGAAPYQAAFAADGALMALTHSRSIVQLMDPATGQLFASLESPHPQPACWLSFSADGNRLAVASKNHSIQLWDLDVIRKRLRSLGTDWRRPLPSGPGPQRAADLDDTVATKKSR